MILAPVGALVLPDLKGPKAAGEQRDRLAQLVTLELMAALDFQALTVAVGS